jgi:hypothetical protein
VASSPEQVHLIYDVEPYAVTLCKEPANKKRIFLKKSEGKNVELETPPQVIRKAEGESWSTLYCVIAEPGAFEDAGCGDGAGSPVPDMWRDADEIRKAAHFFSRSPKLVNGLHDDLNSIGEVVENAVALADFTVEGPDGESHTIKKGSWYVGICPHAEGKAKVDAGEFTGLSMEATAYRELSDLKKSRRRGVIDFLANLVNMPEGEREALAKELGRVEADPQEDFHVDTKEFTEKFEGLDTEVQEIKKAQGAATTAITGLTDTVNSLVERLEGALKQREEKRDEDADKPTAETLKKSIDDLANKVGGALDKIESDLNALADTGSSQDTDPDNLKKSKSDNPLTGVLFD